MGIPKVVLDLASRGGGYVSREQLMAAGLSTGAIDRLVSTRDIGVVRHGFYLVVRSEDHIDLMRGATLALKDAIVSHQSAAHLLRFPKLPALKPTVVVPSHTTHKFPGVLVRRYDDLAQEDTVQVGGLPVTNVARTLFDLGGVLGFREFDSVGESLVIAGRMRLANFEDVTHRLARRGKPGSGAARGFLAIRAGSDRGASVLERRGRALVLSAGLPSGVAQFPIPWDAQRRFDLAYPTETLAIEWDSRAWHEQRAAMEADRQRDRQAVAHGWVVLRFTWDDVMERPNEVIETLTEVWRDRHPVK